MYAITITDFPESVINQNTVVFRGLKRKVISDRPLIIFLNGTAFLFDLSLITFPTLVNFFNVFIMYLVPLFLSLYHSLAFYYFNLNSVPH